MLVQYSQLLEQDTTVFATLKDNWKFLLKYFPFKDVFNKKSIERARQY